MPSYLS